jgi:hypothetical protein
LRCTNQNKHLEGNRLPLHTGAAQSCHPVEHAEFAHPDEEVIDDAATSQAVGGIWRSAAEQQVRDAQVATHGGLPGQAVRDAFLAAPSHDPCLATSTTKCLVCG